MSADDFQTKYASVMESMLKSAVAETTKLFETMVDELKAEISTIKKENEDLKTRCSQFENAKRRVITAHTGESEPPPGPRDGSEKRDTAVQCDLVPFHNMLVEQCQQTRHQEQQCNYGFQNDHDYGGGNEMPFVKKEIQEEIEPTMVCRQLLSNHADSPQTSACGTEMEGLFFNQGSNGSMSLPQKDEETRVAMELPFIGMDSILQGAQKQSFEHEYSQVISLATITYDMEEKSDVGLKISEIRTQGKLITSTAQAAQQQSEVEPHEAEKLSMSKMSSEEMHVTVQQSTDMDYAGEFLAKPMLLNKEVAFDELKSASTEGEAISKPEAVCRKRGRPSKKIKCLLQLVKETSKSTSTEVQTDQEVPQTVEISTESIGEASSKPGSECRRRGRPPKNARSFQQTVKGIPKPPSIDVQTDQEVHQVTEEPLAEPITPNNEVACEELKSISTEGEASSKPGSVCCRRGRPPKKTKHLQQPVKEMLNSTSTDQVVHQAPSAEVLQANESLNAQPAESLQHRERRSSVTLQDAILLVEAMNQSTAKNIASTSQRTAPPQIQCSPRVVTLQTVDEVPAQLPAPGTSPQTPPDVAGHLAVETPCDVSQTTHVTESVKPQAHVMLLIPQQPNSTSSSKTDTSPSSSTASTQTAVSLKQPWITTPVNPNNPLSNTFLNKIIVVPRTASSIATHKIAALSPTQLSTVVSAVAASRKNSSVPVSTAAGLPLGVFSLSSLSPKTIYVTSPKSNPVITPLTSTSSTHQQSATLPFPKITILIPRPVVATSAQQSQEKFVQTTKQEAAEPVPVVNVSSPLLIPSSQQINDDTDTQTTSDQEDKTSSVGLAPVTMSPEASLTTEQKRSPVIKLSRLPFPISTKESVLISRVLLNESSEGNMPEEQASMVKPIVSEMPTISTEICPDVKEPIVIQEKALLSSGPARNILDGEPVNVCVQPSTPSEVSAQVLKISDNMIQSSAVSGTASDPASNSDEEVKDCVLPMIQEKESATFIQLTSIAPKDKADPHLQMTKTQFLAQLAVSPVVQDSKTASTNDFADGSLGYMRKLRKNSLVARLRSHFRIHLQARRRGANPELHTETEILPGSTKKPKLEYDSENETSTSEPFPVSPKPSEEDDDASLSNTTNDSTSISPTGSGLWEDGVRQTRAVREPSFLSCRAKLPKNSPDTKKVASESTPVSPRTSSVDQDDVDTEYTKYTRGRSRSIKIGGRFARVSPRRPCSTKDGAITKSTSVSPKRCSSIRDSPKKTKSTSASPTHSSEDASPKTTNESTPASLRKFSFTNDGSSTKRIKRDCNSFSPLRYSNITDGGEICTQSARWPKLAKNSPRKIGETVPARSRLIQDSKKTLRLLNTKKLSKSKTLAKIKTAKISLLQNAAKTRHLAKIGSGCEALKRIKSAGVWIPPIVPVGSMSPSEGKSLSFSPAPKTHAELYPPSVSRHPIPIKAPPMVSPLQPLSVIGGRLLKNQCGECGCVFTSSVALESHVSLHTGHRPFSCSLCGKRFLDSKGLKRHDRVHRNGRIHVCQQCGKGFVYRFGLTKHIQMVHRRIKPFVCQICTKAFFTKRDVENHIRIHTGEKPFKCNLCERKFARRVELNVHLRWHNGEKRHWCTYCTKGFLDLNNLKRHLYTHTGEKPQACPHCPKHFKQSGHLKKHITNVHKL